MAVCYKKLWKLLIDKNMNKTELRMMAGITTTALAKLGRDENVNTEVLAKICQTLNCKIEDMPNGTFFDTVGLMHLERGIISECNHPK